MSCYLLEICTWRSPLNSYYLFFLGQSSSRVWLCWIQEESWCRESSSLHGWCMHSTLCLALSFFFRSTNKCPTSSAKNLFRVKLMEMLLSWDLHFNHAKGLHHLRRFLPLQKEMLLQMTKVLAVLKRMPSSVLGNVSFWSFVTIITISYCFVVNSAPSKDFFSSERACFISIMV